MTLRTWRPVIIYLGQCSAPENFPNGCHFHCQTLNFKKNPPNAEICCEDAIWEPLLAQLEDLFSQVCQYLVFFFCFCFVLLSKMHTSRPQYIDLLPCIARFMGNSILAAILVVITESDLKDWLSSHRHWRGSIILLLCTRISPLLTLMSI